MAILGDVLRDSGVGAPGILNEDLEVPVLTAPQAQGDLIILPRPDHTPATTPIPPTGVAVVQGEATSNTHSLHSWDGECRWDTYDVLDGLQTLGVLTVPAGASAYLVHTAEHGANGIGPGTYVIRRQRDVRGTIAD